AERELADREVAEREVAEHGATPTLLGRPASPPTDGPRRLHPEPLDPMVVRVDDRDAPLMIDRQRPGVVQLAGPPARLAPDAKRAAVEGELLHALVAILAHVQALVGADRQVVWVRQLP